MAMAFHEDYASREMTDNGAVEYVRKGVVEGTDNPTDAHNFAWSISTLPIILGGTIYGTQVFRREIRVNRIGQESIETEIIYRTPDSSTVIENRESCQIDAGMESIHIGNAISQTRYDTDNSGGVACGADEMLIGVNADKTIEGTDTEVPVEMATFTVWMSPANVGLTFRNAMRSLTGKVNQAAWKDWQIGCVLFDGASYSNTRGELVQVTFRFRIRPQETINLKLDDGTAVGPITKAGWDLTWVKPGQGGTAISDGAGIVGPMFGIHVLYIAQIYARGDFSGITPLVVSYTNWANHTAYVVDDVRKDTAASTLWRCVVEHTSAVAPTTFAQDRTANPTFWIPEWGP